MPHLGDGKICYIEIPAKNIDASRAFYEAALGWTTRKRSDGSVAFDDGACEVSGTWKTDREPSADPGLLIYIMVDDIDAAIRKVEAAGGQIVQAVGADHPELTARFSDPAGNVLGLYQERG